MYFLSTIFSLKLSNTQFWKHSSIFQSSHLQFCTQSLTAQGKNKYQLSRNSVKCLLRKHKDLNSILTACIKIVILVQEHRDKMRPMAHWPVSLLSLVSSKPMRDPVWNEVDNLSEEWHMKVSSGLYLHVHTGAHRNMYKHVYTKKSI